MDRIAVLPDIRPTGYLGILKFGYPVGAGYRIYFTACLLFDRVTQIIETSQIFKQFSKHFLLIPSLPDIRPDIRKPDIRFFNIRYPAGYRIAEKWPDFAGYQILNRISGPSLLIIKGLLSRSGYLSVGFFLY